MVRKTDSTLPILFSTGSNITKRGFARLFISIFYEFLFGIATLFPLYKIVLQKECLLTISKVELFEIKFLLRLSEYNLKLVNQN